MGLRSSKLMMGSVGGCSMGIKLSKMMGRSPSILRRLGSGSGGGGGGSTISTTGSSSSSSSSSSADHHHHQYRLAPKGYVPISVGVSKEDSKRFVIHTTALGDADFLEFLCRSAEEYGFCNDGVLRIPYEARAFEEWITNDAKHKMLKVKPT